MNAAHRMAMPASARPETLGRDRLVIERDSFFGRYPGRLPLRCQASVASSNAAACRRSSAIQRLILASSAASRSGPCNSVTHRAACTRIRLGAILFSRAIRDSIFFRLAVLHDCQQRTRNMSFDRDVGYAQVAGDFRIAIAGAACEIYFARSQAHTVQQLSDVIQTLLCLQGVLERRFRGDQRTLGIEILNWHLPA